MSGLGGAKLNVLGRLSIMMLSALFAVSCVSEVNEPPPPTRASFTLTSDSTFGVLDFGPQHTDGSITTVTINFTNSGKEDASNLSMSILDTTNFGFQGGAYPGTSGTCSSEVLKGESCSIVLEFSPTATGDLSSSLSYTFFDDVEQVTLIGTLEGFGVNPATRFVFDDPNDTFQTLTETVTLRAVDAIGTTDILFQDDVTVLLTGSATGAGLIDLVDGIGSFDITNAVAETVTMSFSDTQGTGLDVSATEDIVFQSAPAIEFVLVDPGDTEVNDPADVVIEARNTFGNIDTTFGQDVTLNVSGSATGGGLIDIVSGSATVPVNDLVAETVNLTMTDSQGTGLDVSSAIDIYFDNAPAVDVFIIDPSDNTVGFPVTVQVEARDPYGNIDDDYNTDVDLVTTGSATGAGRVDIVSGIGTIIINDLVAETVNLSLVDTYGTGFPLASTQNVVFVPGVLDNFLVTGVSDPVVAGTLESITVTARDQYGNTLPTYTGTVAFSSTDGTASLPANYTFVGADAGVHTFTNGVQLTVTGDWDITVTDTSDPTKDGTQADITVLPAAIDSFTVAGSNDPTTTDNQEDLLITAYDQYGNVKTDYTGTVTLSSDDAAAILASDYTFVVGDSGVRTITNAVQFQTTGTWYVQANDTVTTAALGQQAGINVNPGAIDNFTVAGIADPTNADSTDSVTVTAYDAAGNVKTDYTGTITFSSDDPIAVLPSNYTFLVGDSGVAAFAGSIDLRTTGSFYVRVNDTVATSALGEQSAIDVNPGAIAQFSVVGISDPTTTDSLETPVITAQDQYANTKTDYLGTIAFSSDDGVAVLPANYTFTGVDAGVATFTNGVQFQTTGNFYLAVQDTVTVIATGQQSAIDVNPGAIDYFTVAGVSDPNTTDDLESPIVSAFDAAGNVKTDYLGTVTFSSDDLAAILPIDYTFTAGDAGIHTFTNELQFQTTGTYYLQVSDTVAVAAVGSQTGIDVNPGAISSFTVTGISDPTDADLLETPTVVAFDAAGNVKTDYIGTISFSSNDGAAVLPADYTFLIGDSGSRVFTNGVDLRTTGTYFVRVTDTVVGSATGEQSSIDVNPGAIDSFTVTGVTDPTNTDATQSPVVTAYDQHGNIKTDYTGTVQLTSDDGAAILPANYAYVLGDAGVRTFTNGVQFQTTGTFYLQAQDIVDVAATGQQTNIDVTPGAISYFSVASISDPTNSDVTESPVVTAYDAAGNIKTDYVGTVTFSSDDGSAVLPSNYTFVLGDAGVHTFTNELDLKTTGTYYVAVNDTVITGATGQQTNIDVNPGTIDSFLVSGISDPTDADSLESVTVTARDAAGNTKTDYLGTISFTSDDGAAILPTDYTFLVGDLGSHTFANGIDLRTTGSYFVRVTDTVVPAATGEQSAIDVNPGAIDNFVVTGVSDPTTTDAQESPVVTARDQYNNTKTDYVGTVTFSSDDGGAVLPSNYTFLVGDAGVRTFSNELQMQTTGSFYVQVNDTVTPAASGQQAGIDVNPGAIDSFTVTGISDPTNADTLETATITAFDAAGNIKTDYVGTISFTSDDSSAVLPADYTFLVGDSGSRVFANGINLRTTGSYYVRVNDTVATAALGEQSAIDVNPGAIDNFLVTGVTDPTEAGVDRTPVVTARDQYNNVKTDYVGTVTFSSDDGAAILPADYTFLAGDSGVHTFTNELQFQTTGVFYVQATDTVVPAATGQQTNIDVTAGPLDHFLMSGVSDPTVAGTAETVTVTARDVFNNTRTQHTGTVTFLSDDPQAVLPADYTFVLGDSGVATFTNAIQLRTTGTYYVRVEDSSDNTLFGEQTSIDVNPAAIDSFTVSGISDPTDTDSDESPTVTAYDQFNNIKTDYVGTITFTSDDGAATLPADYTYLVGDAGVASFANGVNFGTTGSFFVRVTDTVVPAATGEQTSIDVNPGALDSFTLTGITDPTTTDATESPVVTAYDADGNVKTDYVGTVTFSSDDGAATLPADYTFLVGDSGTRTFTNGVDFGTTGTFYVEVADTVLTGITAQQAAIDVNPGALDSFTLTGITDPTTTDATESPVVTAYDADGNVKTDYVGTVTFSSDDGAATLPADYTFLVGDSGTRTFANGVDFGTTGTFYVEVGDTVLTGVTAQQSAIDVNPGALNSFTVTAISDPTTTDSFESPVVTALDADGNVKTDYVGTITFTSDDGAATLPGDYSFLLADAGTATFVNGVDFDTTGTFFVRVNDTVLTGITGEQSSIDVNPGVLNSFTLTGITDPTTTDATESPVVTAYDADGNVKTDYVGTIAFASDDGGATLPVNYTFALLDSGTRTFTNGIDFAGVGSFYVRVNDTVSTGITGEQSAIDVNVGVLASFTITGITDPTTTDATESPVVTAFDADGNVKTDYVGTVTFSSDDGAATLPADYTFLVGDSGTRTFTNGVDFGTTGSFYVEVGDTVLTGITAQQSAIDVNPGALNSFTLTGITDPTTTDSTESPVVTAYDADGNVKTDYVGTVTFSSDDGAATLPADYTFLVGDSGTRTFTNGVDFGTTGTFYVEVADTVLTGITAQQSAIDVNPGALNSFTLTGITDPTTTDATESPLVTAYDADGNVKTDYVGTVTFSSDDGAATLPADYTFLVGDSGTRTFTNGVDFGTTGTFYVEVGDTVFTGITAQQAAIDVNPGALDSFTLTGITDPTTTDATESPVVTAYDADGNVKTDYVGTVTFSSNDGTATLPGDYTFLVGDSGTHTFTNGVDFDDVGSFYVRVTDTVVGTATGEQSAIDVSPGALNSFTLTGITDPTTTDATESPVVTAFDADGNVKTDYVGTVTFSSDDGGATLPADYTFLVGDSGTRTFTNGVDFGTTGIFYVEVADTVLTGITAQQAGIDVNPGAIDSFTVTGITDPTTTDATESPVVTALDADGNVKTDYVGTVTFSSDDGAATLPTDYTFLVGDSGARTFTNGVDFGTTGSFFVRVTDTVVGTATGEQSAIDVNPGVLDSFTITGITDPTTTDSTESPVVTAYDADGNIKTDYVGTVTFSSDDGTASLPADYTFLVGDSGTRTFTNGVDFGTTGTFYVEVADTVLTGITAQQLAIDVNPGALNSFTLTGITDPTTTDATESPVVTAYDADGNVKTDYVGTVTFSSDDGAATLPADYTFLVGDSGTRTFTNGVDFASVGSFFVQVSDTVATGVTAQQTNIDVSVGAIDSFTVTGIGDPTSTVQDHTPVVTALDGDGNVKTDYVGTITFSSDDGTATLPADYTFVLGDAGVRSFTNGVRLQSNGTYYVRVTDTVVPAATGQQSDIDVTLGPISYFVVSGITDPTNTDADETVTVTAYDPANNIKTDYVGTITFSSDDGGATLPANYTFVPGDAGVRTFTNGVNFSQTGTFYVEVEDTVDSSATGQQSNIDVNPGAIDSFTVTSITDPTDTDATVSPVVTAYDADGNIKTDYVGTVTFSSDDGAATLPADYTFLLGDGGTRTFTNGVDFGTTGTFYVRVTDTVVGTATGDQTSIDVNPGAIDSFTITGITDPTDTDATESPVVTAYDADGNIKTDYVGTITFTSDDATATLPADYTFLVGDSGTRTFTNGVDFDDVGSFYIRVTDTVVGTATGEQSAIDVNPGAIDSFTVTSITDPTTTDATESPVVTAYDADGNIKTDYVGTIAFTSDDATATLPANYTFLVGDSGTRTFTNGVDFADVGSFYVRVTDTVVGTATGEQVSIDVNPGAIDSFTVTGITDPTDTDATESPVVTALDSDGNVKTDYVGTVTFSSDDGAATLPADYTFLVGDSGTRTFTNGVDFGTTGSFYVRVTDTVVGTATGEQTGIDVDPGDLDSFTVTGVTDPTTTDATESPVVTAYDADGNIKTDYVGTVTFTSDDGAATLPANYAFLLADGGTHTFTNELDFGTTGSFYLEVSDTVIVAATGQQTGIDVDPGALSSFTITGITDPTTTDATESPVVTAYDADGNIKTDYVGTVTFTSDDGAATLPSDYTFLVLDNGSRTFTNSVDFGTTGSFYVEVSDTVATGVTAQQSGIDVNPGAIDSFTVTGVTDPTTTDATESPVVTALDSDGNIKTDYVGTITFSSDDASASLPSDYTFLVGDSGTRTFTNGVDFDDVGSFYVRVTDTVVGTATGEQSGIDVNPGAIDSFTVTGVTDPTTTDATESPVVTAFDADGNIKTDYVGTITFSSDDATATLPGDYTFLLGDSGMRTFTNGVDFDDVGTFYVRVTDTVVGTATGEQTAIDVNPGAIDSFTVTGITDPTTTDATESPVVTAYDADGNIKTDYVGTITFSSDDGTATLPGDYTFLVGDSGTRAFTNGVDFADVGSFYVRVTDTVVGTATGEQSAIDVNPGAIDSFTVTGITDPTTTDATESPVVTAYDADGNIKTDYVGTITFSSDDGTATLPGDYTFLVGDSGTRTFTNGVDFDDVGSFYVRVTDTVVGTATGEQSAIDVNPGAIDSFTVTGITDPTTTDATESPVVTAYDADGNIKTDYVGTITFSSDDGTATLPGDYTFLLGDSGTRTFTNSVDFADVGSFYVRVTDTVVGTATGEQSAIDVNPGAIDSFTVTGITDPTTTDATESPVVTAYDADGNIKTDYVGTITFSSDDGTATLPGDYTFLVGDSGTRTFTNGVDFDDVGSFYVRVTDTVVGTATGEQSAIDVNPGALSSFTLTGVSDPTTTDNDESPVVTAYDADGNVKTDYVGTVTFTSDDATASLPADYTFLVGDSGTHTFTNELNFDDVGTFFVQVADTVLTGVTAQQSGIDVNPGAIDSFTVTGITDPTTTDATESPVVTAYDADGNIKTDYVGTITFSSDDGTATLPANYTFLVGDSGTRTFTNGVDFDDVGSFYVRVTDTVVGTATGEQSAIDVNPGAIDSFTVTGITDPTTTDATESPVVTALDADGNVKSDYVGTITFSSDDATATLPANYTFLVGDSGTRTFTNGVDFDDVGSFYVRVTDTVVGTATGEQTAIDVNPGAIDSFTVTGVTDPTTTDATESPVVTAYDADGNIKTDYVGTITFSSDDGTATLPGDYTFLVGDSGTRTFTNGVDFADVGTFYVRVTDTVVGTAMGEQSAIDVNPGTIDSFTVTGINDPTNIDATESPVVTALDADGNVKTDYVGTITFSSDDATATLPGDYTFLVGDSGTRTFTNGVDFADVGSFYVRVTDTVVGTATGEQSAIDVNPGAISYFTVTGITDPTTTDATESPVVTAYDADGNVKTDYVGTITFSSDDATATLPANYTFLVGDSGTRTFTNGVDFDDVGSFYVRVTDTVVGTATGEQTAIDVNPGAIDSFTVTGITDPTTTDATESPVVTAYDADGNIKTDYVGTITFSSDDGTATLPGDYAFLVGDSGSRTFTNGVDFADVGSFYVRVTDTVVGTATGEQSAIDVGPGAIDSFTVTGITDPTTTDATESPVVTALDADGNIKTDYVGTITFSSDDGAATLPANYTFLVGDSGTRTFTNGVDFDDVGSFYVRVTDTVVGTATGEQSAIDVDPGAIDSFTVTGITDPTTTDATESPVVTAYDADGNIKTDYVGTITFSSDDGTATLPGDYTFLVGDSGTRTFTNGVDFADVGSFYVRVTDTVVGTATGEQSAIDVNPGAVDSFTVTGITDPTTTDATESPVVTAYDADGNIKTDYVGTITFSSDDATATLPGDYTFLVGDSGTRTFTNGVDFADVGSFYVRVTDTVVGTATGEQSAIDVNPGAIDSFTVTGITDPTDTDATESPVVTALDADGNVKTDYVGTVTFTSDDAGATLPVDYTFLVGDSGVHTFTNELSFDGVGSFFVTVTDTVVGTATGSQTAIDVNPGVISYFTVTGVTDPTTTDATESPVVTAYDAYGNVKTDYVGTIAFSSDDATATLPADYTFLVGDSGTRTFTNGVDFADVGSFYVRVTDTVVGTATGEQSAIDVGPGAIDSFTVTGVTDPTTTDATESPVVTALDADGNVKTDYVGTVTFSSDDATATLPGDYTFLVGDSGTRTFTNGVDFDDIGSFYVRVTDTVVGTATGEQSAIDVSPGAIDSFTVSGVTDPTTTDANESPVVTAYDADGNVKTDYVGTITFSSDDAGATLPANYTFLVGDSGVASFASGVNFSDVGSFYVRVTDTVVGTATGEQSAIDVNPGAIDSFVVASITDPTDTDTDESPIVTAYDGDGNIKTDYVGTITFTSDDATATLPADYTFLVGDSGTRTFTNGVNFDDVGSFFVRVTDTVVGTATGEQSAIDVNAGALDSFTITGITDPTTTDATESPVVTAYDADGNVKTNYVGTVTFSSDDGSAVLPSNYTFVLGDAGTRTFTNELDFETTGTFYVEVADTVLTGITAQQTGIDVSPGAIDSFTVASVSDPTDTDTDESPVVTAYDADGNIKTDYVGTITFSSDDATATLPVDYTFVLGDAGTRTFTNGVNFDDVGSFFVRVTDTVVGTATGEQTAIDVGPGALASFTVTGVSDPTNADATETPVVTAYDADGNIKTDYVGTVTFSSDDGAAVLPADYTFLVGDSGVRTFTNELDLRTTGTFYLEVADTVLTGITAQQTGIDVDPGALSDFVVTGISDPATAGTPETAIVTARDQYGNTKTDYTGTIAFSSDDVAAVLPADYTFTGPDAGVRTFTSGVDLRTVGSFYVRVNDTVSTGITGEQAAIDVDHGAAMFYVIEDPSDSVVGTPTTVTVNVYDNYSNIATSFGTDVTLNTDGSATGGGLVAITSGTGSRNIDDNVAETVNLSLTDSQGSGLDVTSTQDVVFDPGPATQLVITTGPSDPTVAGAEIPIVVEIRDALGNVVDIGADATAQITLSLQSGTGALGGTITENAVNGVADFTGNGAFVNLVGAKTIRLTKADTTGGGGTGTLTVDTASFTVNHAPASQLTWTTSPIDPTLSQEELAAVIEVQDAYGNLVDTGVDATTNVTLSIQSGTGTLGGVTTMAFVAGVADYTGLGVNIDLAGTKTLRATKADTTGSGGTGIATGDSASFDISGSAVLTISESNPYDYGDHEVGSTRDRAFILENTGELDAINISGSGLTGDFAFVGGTFPGGGSCGTTLTVGNTCTFVVRFSPSAEATVTDTIDIDYDDSGTSGKLVQRDIKGTGTPDIFEPGDISNLQVWLDSDDASTLWQNSGCSTSAGVSGDAIGCWEDKSGNNRDFLQTAGGEQPQIGSKQFSNKNAISFDGINDGLLSSYNLNATPYTVAIVYSYESGTSANRRAMQGSNANWYIGPHSNTYAFNAGGAVDSGTTTTNGQAVVVVATSDGSESYHWLDGVADTGSTAPTSSPGILGLGAEGNAADPLDGYVMEVVVYDKVLSVVERKQLEEYLGDKWTSGPSASQTPIALWVDASDQSSLFQNQYCTTAVTTTGQNIGCWKDKSGNNNNLIQSTSSLRPTVTFDALNEEHTIDLDGTDYFQDVTLNATSGAQTVFMVVRADAEGAMHVFDNDSGSTSKPSLEVNNASPSKYSMTDGDAVSTSDASLSEWYFITMVYDPGAGTPQILYVNGIQEDTSGTATDTDASFTYQFFNSAGSSIFQGEVGEIIVYTDALSNNDRQGVEDYLRRKWFANPKWIPNLTAWYDGADRSTVLDTAGRDGNDGLFNGDAEYWLDKSNSANTHDAYRTGGTRPQYDPVTGIFTFSGSEWFDINNNNDMNMGTHTERSYIMALRTGADITNCRMAFEEGGGTRGMSIYVQSGNLYLGYWNNTDDSDGVQPVIYISTPVATNTTYYIVYSFDYSNYSGPTGPDGNINGYINGVDFGFSPTTSRLFQHAADINIGDGPSTRTHTGAGSCGTWQGEIYEFGVMSHGISAEEALNVYKYFDSKW